jgi:hypothetical protein
MSRYNTEGSPRASTTFFRTKDGRETWFRSRLEARWALTFEKLHIKWEYEPCGFDLPSGTYTPDFYLPGAGWIEIKPTFDHLYDKKHKLRQFARHKRELLEDEEAPDFYSITARAPTFSFETSAGDPLLLEWLEEGYRIRDKTYALRHFSSEKYSGLRSCNFKLYSDHVDRVCVSAQGAHFNEPLHIRHISPNLHPETSSW